MIMFRGRRYGGTRSKVDEFIFGALGIILLIVIVGGLVYLPFKIANEEERKAKCEMAGGIMLNRDGCVRGIERVPL